MVPNEMMKKDEGVFSISLWLGIKCVNKTATSNPNPLLYTYLKRLSQMKCRKKMKVYFLFLCD